MISERRQAMLAVQQSDFVLLELNLYLDTHPDCRQGLTALAQARQTAEAAVTAYTNKYGPLYATQSNDQTHWQWIDAPWPWELEG